MNIKSKISIFFICIILSFSTYAQKEKKIIYDKNGEIIVREFDVEKYKNDSDFDYEREFVKAPETLMQRLWYWIGRFFRAVGKGGFISWIFYIIIFAIITLVVIKLIGLNYQKLFYKNRKIKGNVDIETYDENIHDIDFKKIIDEAINKENYGKAVRYLYLKLLKTLTDNEIIEWEINKTNRDYRREISKSKYGKNFYRLTFNYEYTWYGKFEINKKRFDEIHKEFRDFYKKIT